MMRKERQPPHRSEQPKMIHKVHVAGGYVPAKKRLTPARIVRWPKATEE
jgi:hypothetical protein